MPGASRFCSKRIEEGADDMTGITRRDVVNGSACAAVAGGAMSFDIAKEADALGQDAAGGAKMSIHFGVSQPTGDIPIISFATVHNDIVYLCGVTADPDHLGDVKDQTRQVLDRIDRLLIWAGSDKSKLLSVQVWLADMTHFADHNSVWNAWVDAKNPPARACLQSPRLWRPGMLVEIMATAAR
jgi:enamine deaminase RidA (YjgF/YER057c/UK114 family)